MESSGESAYLPGRILLDKYELLSPLAEGGMGVVWLARHMALEVDVAVKLTPSDRTVSEHARQRALSEARLAAQLAHPAICRVLDFGLTEEGDPCVVTELLRGETLERALLLEGQLRPIEAVQILLPILDALAAAHEQGVVHQDVKPSNIFLARDARGSVQPKLLDFGIARARDERASWQLSGTVSGTPCYMSPEQASASDDVDHRSDLWSACASLYELLTGVPPFDGESCATLLTQVVRAEPRPLSAFSVEDPKLAAIVSKGMQKDPEQRWQSAAELADALARWLLAQGVDADICGHALRTRLYGLGVRLPPSERPRASATNTLVVPQAPLSTPLDRGARRLATRAASPETRRLVAVAIGAIVIVAASGSVLRARPTSSTPQKPGIVTVSQAAAPAALPADHMPTEGAPRPPALVAVAEPLAAPGDPTGDPSTDAEQTALRVSHSAPQEAQARRSALPTPAERPKLRAAGTPTTLGSAARDFGSRGERVARTRANDLDYDFGF